MFTWLQTTFLKKNYIYEPQPLMPRTVNITGVNFHFSMPENFSLDMPADDLVERVNLDEYSHLPDTRYIALMKRWWDFYHGRPHARNVIGTMMLSFDLIPKREDINGSLFNYEPMVNTVYRDILNDFSDPSTEDGVMEDTLLPESAQSLTEFVVNGRNWVIGFAGRTYHNLVTLNFYCTPISDDWYLRASFEHSKGGGKNSGLVHRRSIGEQMRILETCELEFLTEVPARPPVEYEIPTGPPLTQEEIDAFNKRNDAYFAGKLK